MVTPSHYGVFVGWWETMSGMEAARAGFLTVAVVVHLVGKDERVLIQVVNNELNPRFRQSLPLSMVHHVLTHEPLNFLKPGSGLQSLARRP